eukprot:4169544-Amphidinium_carterae.1
MRVLHELWQGDQVSSCMVLHGQQEAKVQKVQYGQYHPGASKEPVAQTSRAHDRDRDLPLYPVRCNFPKHE